MSLVVYRKLFRSSDVRRLVVAFLAIGVAGTMTPVAFLLFAHAATGSYASASLVLAASTAGNLLAGPARGRLIDRVGPRAAVLRLTVPDIITDIAFIVGGHAHAATALLVALAFVGGAIAAPASTALRTVWSQTLPEGERHAGYALMGMMVETDYILGPLVAGGLIALWSPTAAVAFSAVLSFAGALLFAAARMPDASAERPAHSGWLPALRGRAIRVVVATGALFGLTFGILDVAFPTFARAHGSTAVAGVLLSAFAAGSWAGGFLYGLRNPAAAAGRRYPVLCLIAALGLAPLILTPPLVAMVVLAVLSGVCFAPLSTSQIAIIDDVAPVGHVAEAYTWLGTLYGTGLAIGAAVAGQLVACAVERAALAVACSAALAAWLIATARAGALRSPVGLTADLRDGSA